MRLLIKVGFIEFIRGKSKDQNYRKIAMIFSVKKPNLHQFHWFRMFS